MSWFQNVRFEHRGLTFVGLDWVTRAEGFVESEMADLHDFEGGTFRFLAAEIDGLETNDTEDVLLFSHHPMIVGCGPRHRKTCRLWSHAG